MSNLLSRLLLLPFALCLLAAPVARADDEPAPEPKRHRVRVRLEKEDKPAPKETEGEKKDPMDAVMRWLMGEAGEKARSAEADFERMVDRWMKGGDDVPLAGLRDLLVEDGWTAGSLVEWIHGHLGAEGCDLAILGEVLPRLMHGPRTWHPFVGPDLGPWMGGGPRWQGRGEGGRGFGGRMRGMRGRGVRPGRRGPGAGGPRWERFFFGGGPAGPDGRVGPGMPPFGAHGGGRSRTVLLWNDGRGWHREEWDGAPEDAAHGRGGTPWGGSDCECPFCGGPGRGGPFRGPMGRGNPEGLDPRVLGPWLKKWMRHDEASDGNAGDLEDVELFLESLGEQEGEEGDDMPEALRDFIKRRVRVKLEPGDARVRMPVPPEPPQPPEAPKAPESPLK